MEKQICAYIPQAKRKNAKIVLEQNGNVVWETTEDLSPVKVYETEVALQVEDKTKSDGSCIECRWKRTGILHAFKRRDPEDSGTGTGSKGSKGDPDLRGAVSDWLYISNSTVMLPICQMIIIWRD